MFEGLLVLGVFFLAQTAAQPVHSAPGFEQFVLKGGSRLLQVAL